MNVEILIILGKVVAWLLLIFSVFAGISAITVIRENNSDEFKVMSRGKLKVEASFVVMEIILILVSSGFLIGTCGM